MVRFLPNIKDIKGLKGKPIESRLISIEIVSYQYISLTLQKRLQGKIDWT